MPYAKSVVTDLLAPFRKLEAEAMQQIDRKTDGATPKEAAAFWRELAEEGTVPLEELSTKQGMESK